MDDTANMDRYQDTLGQLPMLQAYSHILYFFAMPEGESKEQITHDLSDAVTKVRQEVPWIGARVVNIDRTAGSSGSYRPVACAPPSPAIVVKDVTETMPAYSLIKGRRAPLSLVDSALLTPVPGFPVKFEDTEAHPAHVVYLQASFLDGGVAVDFAIDHNMADARGHYVFINLIATALRGEDFDPGVLQQANMDRRNAVPLLAPEEPMLDHSHHKRAPVTSDAPLVPPRPASYHIFRFTAAKLAKIKRLATSKEGPVCSTDDAICALCWQTIIAARQSYFPGGTSSRFGRQADGRSLVGLPPGYTGDTVHTVSAWLTFDQLARLSLADVAAHLRAELQKGNTAYQLRSFATFIHREWDRSTITYAGQFDPDVDVGCTSTRSLGREAWADFGKLGRPDFIRRPPSVPFPSTVALFPGTMEGGCDAILCLTERDFTGLMRDERWMRFSEYIG